MWTASRYGMEKGLSWAIGKLPSLLPRARAALPRDTGLGFHAYFTTARGTWLRNDILYALVAHCDSHPPEEPSFSFHLDPLGYYKDYLLVGVHMISKACHSQVQVYYDLYNDPPDPEFDSLVTLDLISYQEPIGPGREHRDHMKFHGALSEQAQIGVALRRSYEKFLGAAEVEDYYWAKLQNESLLKYATLFETSLDSAIAVTERIKTWVIDLGVGDAAHDGDTLSMFQARIDTLGFTEEELTTMCDVGMTPSEIESLRVGILETDPWAFDGISVSASLDSLVSGMSATVTALGGIMADGEGVRDRLRNIPRDHPTASITAPESVPEGSPVALSGGGSVDPLGGPLAFAWDLDADGEFDDAVGSDITPVWNREGAFLVGLEATGATALKDVAYARLEITDVNDGPHFMAASPESVFVPCDTLPLTFTVEGSPLSPNNRWVWRLRVVTSDVEPPELPPPTSMVTFLGSQPNPFGESTTLTFSVATETRVGISIYDVAGRRVRVLEDRVHRPGEHALTWDGRDQRGVPVSGGTYLCRIEAEGTVLTRTIVLIKGVR
jgi:hypothetical protein